MMNVQKEILHIEYSRSWNSKNVIR